MRFRELGKKDCTRRLSTYLAPPLPALFFAPPSSLRFILLAGAPRAAGFHGLRRWQRKSLGRPDGGVHELVHRPHRHDPGHAIGRPSVAVVGRRRRGRRGCSRVDRDRVG